MGMGWQANLRSNITYIGGRNEREWIRNMLNPNNVGGDDILNFFHHPKADPPQVKGVCYFDQRFINDVWYMHVRVYYMSVAAG